jgi:hypothetical protein
MMRREVRHTGRWRTDRRNHKPRFPRKLPKNEWRIVDHACVLPQRTATKEQNRRLQ